MLLGIVAGFIGVWVGLAFSDVADYAMMLIPSGKVKPPDVPIKTLPSNYRHALYGHN